MPLYWRVSCLVAGWSNGGLICVFSLASGPALVSACFCLTGFEFIGFCSLDVTGWLSLFYALGCLCLTVAVAAATTYYLPPASYHHQLPNNLILISTTLTTSVRNNNPHHSDLNGASGVSISDFKELSMSWNSEKEETTETTRSANSKGSQYIAFHTWTKKSLTITTEVGIPHLFQNFYYNDRWRWQDPDERIPNGPLWCSWCKNRELSDRTSNLPVFPWCITFITRNHTELLLFKNIFKFCRKFVAASVHGICSMPPPQFFTKMRPTYNHRI